MALLEGKKALIFGVANHRSLAWGIAQSLAREGAQLVLAYQIRMEKYIKDLAAQIPGTGTVLCDVQNDAEIDTAFAQANEHLGGLDILVHSVAFAPKGEMENPFLQTTREGFITALDISAYSLIALARRAAPLMEARGGGSIMTLTYNASQRVVPKYNVMAIAKAALEAEVRYLAYELGEKNIRVNSISAGPVNTLAARGVPGLGGFLSTTEKIAPLHRNIDQTDVGDTGLFLASNLSRNITGENLFVDSGFNIMSIAE